MKSMDLLNETMKELNITEQMSVNGDGIRASMAWYCVYVRLRNMEVHIQLVCCNLVSTKRRAECVLRAREIR